jgi:hypothetical protein
VLTWEGICLLLKGILNALKSKNSGSLVFSRDHGRFFISGL